MVVVAVHTEQEAFHTPNSRAEPTGGQALQWAVGPVTPELDKTGMKQAAVERSNEDRTGQAVPNQAMAPVTSLMALQEASLN